MHFTPVQSIALILVGILVIWAFCALLGMFEGAIDARKDRRDERLYRRSVLQDNMRELLWMMINTGEDDQGDLRIAYITTIAEYRSL